LRSEQGFRDKSVAAQGGSKNAEPVVDLAIAAGVPEEIVHLRARARVAATLASVARDAEVASLLNQIAEEFEEEACNRELEAARRCYR
jgi:hypothetical protein